ncbi:hypothetical protein LCGC14_0625860 [marine sediment metagenome]|uniref:Uncharacterized protein n=1 Tax=marine sediment metagenome TaxID=412755 RepID=A0A0F9RMU1_9ZZZZ
MGTIRLRKEVRKKKEITKLKEELALNNQKLSEVTAQLKGKLQLISLQKEDASMKVEEMELVLRLGLKVLQPRFKYEEHPDWEQHAKKQVKYALGLSKKKLANFDAQEKELNTQLEHQASMVETRKKEIVVELKKLGLEEKDIFKKEIPSYIG